MAQKQYTTYQADILSFELRDALVGFLKPGRYYGYDNMTEYQTQVSTSVYVEIEHDAGINKYDKTYPTPVLEAERGVAISTQGTIIADDLVSTATQFTIVLSAAVGIFHAVYMEHAYHPSTPGANNATYGVKAGSDGSGPPTLDSPTKQTLLGYILEGAGAADFGDLTWHPQAPEVGDVNLQLELFGYSVGTSLLNKGTINTNIIGSRGYSPGTHVTPFDSLTEAISDLDAAIVANDGDITTIQGTKLDDWATPDDNTDLDATTTEHGLLPKLSDQTDEFLRGDGTWAVPVGGRMVMRTGTFGIDYTILPADADVEQIDLGVAGCPADADVLILSIQGSAAAVPGGSATSRGFRVAATGGPNATIRLHNNDDIAAGLNGEFQIAVPCDSSQQVYICYPGNKSYLTLYVTVVGWQTYTP